MNIGIHNFSYRVLTLALIAVFIGLSVVIFSVSPAASEPEDTVNEPGVSNLSNTLVYNLAPDFSQAPIGKASDDVGAAIAELQGDSGRTAEVSINQSTGVASFVRFRDDGFEMRTPNLATNEATATAFLIEYGAVFGVSDPANELRLLSSDTDAHGLSHVSYRQDYHGVPGFAAVLRVHLNNNGGIYAANGVFIPDLKLNPNPSISSKSAEQIAIATVQTQRNRGGVTLDLAAVNTKLYVFRDGLVEGAPGKNHLVYEVEVANQAISILEFVYVDAHDGAVVEQVTGIYHALDREVSEDNLGNVVWDESNGDPNPITTGWASGSPQQITDWQNEIDGAEETYFLFASMASRDSYNGAGATMRTVNNDPGIDCPNASWNGVSTNYCTDVTGDDTVAHEWGHAYTEYTNNLIYMWQSGALNESYSDIWGEVVDFLNGRGTDTPIGARSAGACSIFGSGLPSTDNSYRWLSGEDDPAFFGAIRDMWNPACYGDPGKVSDTRYWCSDGDSGGVHHNSGVPNHAFALLVDGGTYNGVTVNGLGITKSTHIHWSAQNMLTRSGNFVDHADALEASCSALVGTDLPSLSTSNPNPGLSGQMITNADCTEVADAVAAVELRTEPSQCNFGTMLDPNAPALCQGLGATQTISLTDWEAGLGSWTVGTRDVANPATFDTPDWAVVGSLPDSRPGMAAFVEDNPAYGNCIADTEAGILYLESPVIALPADAEVPRIALDHWNATEPGWDGGNIKVSVNGGPWKLIPAFSFDFNAYNSSLNDPSDNPMAGEVAFTGTNHGVLTGSWGQSQISLLGFARPGDNVKIRIEMGLDGCNGIIGWYVDDVHIYSCEDEVAYYLHMPTIQKPAPPPSPNGPNAGLWEHNFGEFYVTPDRASVDEFAVRVDVPGCGIWTITHTVQTPIVNDQFSFSGSLYYSGTFDTATTASGTTGLSNFAIPECGLVIDAGPENWDGVWINASQPQVLRAKVVAPDLALRPVTDNGKATMMAQPVP